MCALVDTECERKLPYDIEQLFVSMIYGLPVSRVRVVYSEYTAAYICCVWSNVKY